MARVTWEIDIFDEPSELRAKHGLQGLSDKEVFAVEALRMLQETSVGDSESCNFFTVDGDDVDLGEVEL